MSTAGIVGVSLAFVVSLAVTGVLFYKLGQASNNSGNNKLTPTESNTTLTTQGSHQSNETNSPQSGKLNTSLTVNDENAEFYRELGQSLLKLFESGSNFATGEGCDGIRRQEIISGLRGFLRWSEILEGILIPGISCEEGVYFKTDDKSKWDVTVSDIERQVEFGLRDAHISGKFLYVSRENLIKMKNAALQKDLPKVALYRRILSTLDYFNSNDRNYKRIQETAPETFNSKIEELGRAFAEAVESGHLPEDVRDNIQKIYEANSREFCATFFPECIPFGHVFTEESLDYRKRFIHDILMPRLTEMFDLIESRKNQQTQ